VLAICRHVLLIKLLPQLPNRRSISGQHAVLQTVQGPAMYRRHEFPRRQAQKDTGRKVVFPYAAAELEVGVEHGAQGQWDRLQAISSGALL
jgi:hypothetical protein